MPNQITRGKGSFGAIETESLTVAGSSIPGLTGRAWYVDTVNGGANNSGKTRATAVSTMTKALTLVDSNDVIFVRGDVREHCTAPLSVYGVRIIGDVGGRPRHDSAMRWREGATAGNSALLTLREQGWEVHNILFVPQNGYAAIRAHRAETASYPDSSHFIVRGCKFIGPNGIAGAQGKGIEDWGGNHHYLVEDCEFNDLEFAIVATAGSPGIAAPLRDIIRNNIFGANKHDVCMDMSKGLVLNNQFMTAYNASTHPNTVNLAYLSDVSGANRVVGNVFADAAANVVIAKGYKPSTGDVWRNFVTDAADAVVAVPS